MTITRAVRSNIILFRTSVPEGRQKEAVEFYRGALLGQMEFWDNLLQKVQVLPFDKAVSRVTIDINAELKCRRKQIEIPDLFIAATAVSHNLTLATLNKKHFERIGSLKIFE